MRYLKYLLYLLLTLVLLLLATPYCVGLYTKHKVENQLNVVAQAFGAQIHIEHFNTGWLSSDLMLKIKAAQLHTKKPLTIVGDFTIYHGPFTHLIDPEKHTDSGFSWYRLSGVLHMLQQPNNRLKLVMSTPFEGNYSILSMHANNLHVVLSPRMMLMVKQLSAQDLISKNFKHIKTDTVLHHVALTIGKKGDENALHYRINYMKGRMNLTRDQQGRLLGMHHMMLSNIQINAGSQTRASVRMLSIKSIIAYHGNLLSHQFFVSGDDLMFLERQFNQFHLQYTLSSVNSKKLFSLQDQLLRKGLKGLKDNGFRQHCVNLLMTALAGAKLHLNALKLETPLGALHLTGQFIAAKLPENNRRRQLSLLQQAKQSEMKLTITVPKALYDNVRLLHTLLQKEQKEAQKNVLRLFEPTELPGLLNLLFVNHLMLRVKKAYHTVVTYRQNTLRINGLDWPKIYANYLAYQNEQFDLRHKPAVVKNGSVLMSALSLNGQGNQLTTQPGVLIHARAFWQLNKQARLKHNQQIILGLTGVGVTNCLYDGVKNSVATQAIELPNGHLVGIARFMFKAPIKPGTYAVRFRSAQALDCKTAIAHWWHVKGKPPASATLGLVRVK